jgi:hypothetical protein
MRGRIWLSYFLRSIRLAESPTLDVDAERYRFYSDVMNLIATKARSYVAMRRTQQPKGGQIEFLNVDWIFLDLSEHVFHDTHEKDLDPLVLPRAVVELEHSYDRNRIAYSLWKILCIRAPVRALICRQKDRDRTEALARHLEEVVWRGSLMKGTDSDLLVLVGDDSLKEELGSADHYHLYEWRNDGLQVIRMKED